MGVALAASWPPLLGIESMEKKMETTIPLEVSADLEGRVGWLPKAERVKSSSFQLQNLRSAFAHQVSQK